MKKYLTLFLFWNFFLMSTDTQAQVRNLPFVEGQLNSTGDHHRLRIFQTDAVGDKEALTALYEPYSGSQPQ
ncbi:hypothetical protein [Rufibacter tibetensis]|uniref:Uncharacterized protein n=1 Tax=Rufibacter tibetensis TaxID=512763 RepID=A0A0P0CVU4_9BACT|nr:hypothetical protein [Rufibacter tibetensis]ALJ00831.1 hypothetical protein DC20_19870 [Rufibacter tibetensis]